MLNLLTHLLVVCIGSIAIVLVVRTPVAAYDVYYLAVGNSAYQDRAHDIPDANPTAHEIAQKFDQAGAVDGITLMSEHGAYVTRDAVLSALNKMASKAEKAREPLVVYYFIGHGASRAPDWNHVSFLGNYKPSDSADVTRSRALIETREVKQLLENRNLPYILILDNCYHRKFAEDQVIVLPGLAGDITPLLVGSLQRFGSAQADAFRVVGDSIVAAVGLREPAILLYAAKPGDDVATVPHPSKDLYTVGPLARRLLLLLQAAFESKKGLLVGDFLKQMTDPAFDSGSTPGYHQAWIEKAKSAVLIPARE